MPTKIKAQMRARVGAKDAATEGQKEFGREVRLRWRLRQPTPEATSRIETARYDRDRAA